VGLAIRRPFRAPPCDSFLWNVTRDIVHKGRACKAAGVSYPLAEDPVKRHNPRRPGENGRIQHVIVELLNSLASLPTPRALLVQLPAAKQN
jgi:hypothetical protein